MRPLTCLLAARACWCIRCSKLVILTLPAGEPLPLPLAPLAAAALDVDAAGFLDVLELALALPLVLLPLVAALPLVEEAAATLPVLPLPVALDEEGADVDAFGGIVISSAMSKHHSLARDVLRFPPWLLLVGVRVCGVYRSRRPRCRRRGPDAPRD